MMSYREKLCDMRKYDTVEDTFVLYNSKRINAIIPVLSVIACIEDSSLHTRENRGRHFTFTV